MASRINAERRCGAQLLRADRDLTLDPFAVDAGGRFDGWHLPERVGSAGPEPSLPVGRKRAAARARETARRAILVQRSSFAPNAWRGMAGHEKGVMSLLQPMPRGSALTGLQPEPRRQPLGYDT